MCILLCVIFSTLFSYLIYMFIYIIYLQSFIGVHLLYKDLHDNILFPFYLLQPQGFFCFSFFFSLPLKKEDNEKLNQEKHEVL